MSMSREHARLLMQKAAEDVYVLERLAGDAKAPDAIMGFHAQQAVEKCLKAVLTSRGIPYARTHDLAALIDLLDRSCIGLPPKAECLPRLSPFAAEHRYGRLPPESGAEEAFDRDWAMDRVREVTGWAESKLADKVP
jgi:HEPN domain-containing protein